jgi:hypothetical protein
VLSCQAVISMLAINYMRSPSLIVILQQGETAPQQRLP